MYQATVVGHLHPIDSQVSESVQCHAQYSMYAANVLLNKAGLGRQFRVSIRSMFDVR